MYTLKSIVRRGTSFGAALAMFVAAIIPAVIPSLAYADSLNPLTDRSLTLSSSSPGWSNTDGSGNTTYAPPNSGANGQKTGNYFAFKPSSTATVKTMSFQYCTTSAGSCEIPGNDTVRGTDTSTTSDLNVVYPSAAEISNTTNAGAGTITVTSASDQVVGVGTSFTTFLKVNSVFKTAGGNSYTVKSIQSATALTLSATAGTTESGVTYSTTDFDQVVDPATGSVRAVPGYTNTNAKYVFNGGTGDPAEAAKNVAGNFIVMTKTGPTWAPSTGWAASAHNVDTGTGVTNNYIVLTKTAGVALTATQEVKVLFFATNTNYITNPGAGAFFVKINTYNQFFDISAPVSPDVDLSGLQPTTATNVIDGGVTVANVMNQSIQITTKVLETMQFSVGTVDPNTLDSTGSPSEMDDAYGTGPGVTKHTPCDTILPALTSTAPANVLQMGNQAAESSLETTHTYSTHSYWRLSSNSSAGATVYYSGHTLANTVGDEIDPIGPTKANPAKGAEQFGLALANTSNPADASYSTDTTGSPLHQKYSIDYAQEATYENADDNGRTAIHSASLTTDNVLSNASWHTPRLYPLVASANYNDGTGGIDSSVSTQFAFDPMSDTVPVALATEDTDVVDCVTGKMRYIANIAATTPAGIYTTKVNYIAAPQY
ncbi:MAG: hypothetical protein WAW80_05150 [Candidatus Saccharimonadales bacterium]